MVCILRIIDVATCLELYVREAEDIFATEFVLYLVRAVIERKIFRHAFVVIPVFDVFVVHLATADDN